MANPTKFSVGICGGGIGGLCLAVALSRYQDIRVDIYESAEQFKEIGAGVGIWSKAWRILELLGLASDASKIAHSPPDASLCVGFDFRRSDQPSEGFRFHLAEMPYGCIRFHRAEFLDVLVNHLPSGVAHFRKRVVSYSKNGSDGKIQLRFNDDTTASCDVLVGCDGIKSIVRAQMLREMAENGHPEYLDLIDPVFSGTIAYRGVFPIAEISRKQESQNHRPIQLPTVYCGKNKHIVSYSISRGNSMNVVALVSRPELEGKVFQEEWVTEVPKKELLDCYANWEPEAKSLLDCMTRPTRWALHQLKQLPNYVNDRVALLGDAAHAMTPHQAAGGSQAIEDAFVLAEILGNSMTTTETLALALKAYEHIRLPMASSVLHGSRDTGHMYEFNGPQGEDYNMLGLAIQKQWDWVWGNPEEDAESAIAWMQSNLDVKNVAQ